MSQLTCSVTHWTCSSHETHRVCFAMLLLLLIPVSRTPAAIILVIAIVAPLNFIKPSRQRKTVTFRKYTSINLTEFKTDIRTALSACLPHEDAASLVELYAHACSDIIDLHAPLINKVVTIRPDTAWYTKELWLVKTLRRELERCWRKTGLATHRAMYKDQCRVEGRLSGMRRKIIMKEYWMNFQVIKVNFSIFLVDYLE